MRRIFPFGLFRSWARSEFASPSAPSPTPTKSVPSLAKCSDPSVCEPPSDPMQSALAGWALHGGVPTLPRITTSLPGRATSGFAGSAVTRVRRAVRGAAAVGVARVLERVAHVDAAVGGELRVERQTPEPAVVERVHLGAQVDERRRQQLPVLDHSDDAVLLPHEHAAVRSEGHADQSERRNGGDRLRGEPRVGEGVRGGGGSWNESRPAITPMAATRHLVFPRRSTVWALSTPAQLGSDAGAVFDGFFIRLGTTDAPDRPRQGWPSSTASAASSALARGSKRTTSSSSKTAMRVPRSRGDRAHVVEAGAPRCGGRGRWPTRRARRHRSCH